MATSDTLFAGSIPDLYDRLLVPLIFEPYARDLAKRVSATKPQLVLETAAGTGAVTRALASSLADARIVATDLNQPMLDHAKARQSGNTRIEWKQADALALPFEDRTFDVVACQFGAMFFPDKVRGYREALRVLKPGGRFFSTSGTELKKANLPTSSSRLSPRSFLRILLVSSPAPRTAIATEIAFARN
jgi:ubiquinone/menaquinone biosynthesis C-methylase UbiE